MAGDADADADADADLDAVLDSLLDMSPSPPPSNRAAHVLDPAEGNLRVIRLAVRRAIRLEVAEVLAAFRAEFQAELTDIIKQAATDAALKVRSLVLATQRLRVVEEEGEVEGKGGACV